VVRYLSPIVSTTITAILAIVAAIVVVVPTIIMTLIAAVVTAIIAAVIATVIAAIIASGFRSDALRIRWRPLLLPLGCGAARLRAYDCGILLPLLRLLFVHCEVLDVPAAEDDKLVKLVPGRNLE
jgi:Na+/phosphate symporter